MDTKQLTDAEIRSTMTNEQILLERKLTCEAINGAMAFGYQDTNPPPSDDHWLAPFWKVGRQQAELEAKAALPSDAMGAPVAWMSAGFPDGFTKRADVAERWRREDGSVIALYAAPVAADAAASNTHQEAEFEADAKRLALELECIILDCKDTAISAKWWASGMEALEQHQKLLADIAELEPFPPEQQPDWIRNALQPGHNGESTNMLTKQGNMNTSGEHGHGVNTSAAQRVEVAASIIANSLLGQAKEEDVREVEQILRERFPEQAAQSDERAAIELPAPGFIASAKTISAVSAALGAVREYANDRVADQMNRAVNMLLHELGQARATSPQSGEKAEKSFRAAVEEMVALLENGEWVEHVAEAIANGDELASRLETAITELHNDIGTVREARAGAPQAGATLTCESAALAVEAVLDYIKRETQHVSDWMEFVPSKHRLPMIEAAMRCAHTDQRMSDAAHPPLTDGLMHVPCALQLDHANRQYGWLFIPHADGQWVTAARLDDFSLQIVAHWRKSASAGGSDA